MRSLCAVHTVAAGLCFFLQNTFTNQGVSFITRLSVRIILMMIPRSQVSAIKSDSLMGRYLVCPRKVNDRLVNPYKSE